MVSIYAMPLKDFISEKKTQIITFILEASTTNTGMNFKVYRNDG